MTDKPKRKTVYRGSVFSIEEWRLKGTGTRFARMVSSDGVAILPVFEDGSILLERQYRHTLDRYIYEIPAGRIDKGEAPRSAARRELSEETGYLAGRLSFMFKFYEAPGSITQMLHLYLAERLSEGETSFDKDEEISTLKVSREKALQMIRSNKIMDGKTICGVLFWDSCLRKPIGGKP